MHTRTSIDKVTPLEYHLSQNYPNPFSRKTVVKYCLASRTWVRLVVMKSGGEAVDILVDELKGPGTYEAHFDAGIGRGGHRRRLEAGAYPYRLEAGDFTCEKIMILQE